jgi:hypothetical protein
MPLQTVLLVISRSRISPTQEKHRMIYLASALMDVGLFVPTPRTNWLVGLSATKDLLASVYTPVATALAYAAGGRVPA